MLASDADRDVALALLREASVDGRLTLEELAERTELVSALFSSFTRQARWRIARQARYSAVFGSVKLDLRQAVLPAPEIELEAKAVFGGVEVIVPEGVHVELVDQLKDDWRKWAERLTPPRE